MATLRYGSNDLIRRLTNGEEVNGLRLCDSGDGAVASALYFFSEKVAGQGGNQVRENIYIPNFIRINGIKGLRRVISAFENDPKRQWLAEMIADVIADSLEMSMSNSITEGHDLYEDFLTAWESKGRPYQLVVQGRNFKAYPQPEGEVVFVPIGSSFDSAYASSSVPDGMGVQGREAKQTGRRSRKVETKQETEPLSDGTVDTTESKTPDISGEEDEQPEE